MKYNSNGKNPKRPLVGAPANPGTQRPVKGSRNPKRPLVGAPANPGTQRPVKGTGTGVRFPDLPRTNPPTKTTRGAAKPTSGTKPTKRRGGNTMR